MTILDSLRTSWGEQPVGVFAYGIPLVLLGVPPAAAGVFYLFVALYQYVVHTEAAWSLGPLDRVIYTPAPHRVHHSVVRAEADSNYGGFFLVWDRLFGTYTPVRPDGRPAEYGLPDRVATTAREAAVGEFEVFWRGRRAVPGWTGKLRYALVRPRG